MLVAIFYPLIDGGVQQMMQISRGLRERKNAVTSSSVPSVTNDSPEVFRVNEKS